MSDSQWNYLGLSHNPFSDPQREFFPGADREPMLAKVRKLSQWSRPVLAVTGPHGVGKTCLFRALSSSLEAGVVAARVNGSLVSRAGDVLSALVQGYGVAAPAGADAPLLIELIIAHLKDQNENDRTSLVLVDDAHLLEQRAVDDLVHLAGAGAKLAFFSEPQFVESLQRAVERDAETSDDEPLLWHEMLLSPFSREQTAEYLIWRFDEAGYNGRMPFSEHQVDGIHKTSDGFPGRLDFAANEQLMLMTVGGGRTAGIPRKHLWLAGTLACVLGLTLWLWSPGKDLEIDSKTVAVELPRPGATGASGSAVTNRGKPLVSSNQRATESAPKAPSSQSQPASAANTQPTNRSGNAAATRPGTAQAAAAAAPAADQPTDASTTAPEPTPTLSRTVKPVPVEERVAKPPPVANPSRTVRVDPPAPKPAAETVVKPQPASRSVPAASSEPRNAAWLLAQSDASYTIQLIGFGDESRADAYLKSQNQPGRFALFRTQSGERVVHVVTYGVYASQAAAETAVGRLPTTVGKITPWVRPIRSVKSAIRTALQSN